MVKLIFGCGYLGSRVAQAWLDDGHAVFAVTRNRGSADTLAKQGITPIVADVTDPASLAALPIAETVLVAIGYDREAGRSIDQVYVEGLAHLLASLPSEPQRLVYISSTGVYGQTGDVWVDETSACRPIRAGGQACLAAEQLLQRHAYGRRSIILRMGGIYGPGRVPRQKAIQRGEPIAAPTLGYLNLIHVDDAARAVLIAEDRAEGGSLYCLTDNHPVLRGEYYRHVAELLDAPKPTFCAPSREAHVAKRSQSSKRVSSRRFHEQFPFQPRYPTYREGLEQAIEASDA